MKKDLEAARVNPPPTATDTVLQSQQQGGGGGVEELMEALTAQQELYEASE
eukprot:CAMPEP_0173387082 /NCGR_PEP_ID=MMETSP1356-20130122/9631_1 /TAXON_ID=77927 ORGANISM="Hemiselmis virescens, Strain PCC157" /NCGR_SAMPLE_ID=MMETSP1356 /ASSEMBLY_ACC=CAM_ASM_000847 /LENGTH=50 /DNA_ID=CAMNT_0014343559 /DNA_START=375 /DNA_END=524 /DNA_ORIENTATION=-